MLHGRIPLNRTLPIVVSNKAGTTGWKEEEMNDKWLSLVCIFVYLTTETGEAVGQSATAPDPANIPDDQSCYRIDFGGFKATKTKPAAAPSLSVARPYDFTRGEKRSFGFTTKVSGYPPRHLVTLFGGSKGGGICQKVLAAGLAKHAASKAA